MRNWPRIGRRTTTWMSIILLVLLQAQMMTTTTAFVLVPDRLSSHRRCLHHTRPRVSCLHASNKPQRRTNSKRRRQMRYSSSSKSKPKDTFALDDSTSQRRQSSPPKPPPLENKNKNKNNKKRTLDPSSTSPSEPIQTIGGGPALIFEMARRMSIWNDVAVVSSGDEDQPTSTTTTRTSTSTAALSSSSSSVLPRWHPMPGISDVNPNFRTNSPVMNNQGYASSIWRNVRKFNKPSLWRHALRTYQRMKVVEQEDDTKNQSPSSSSSSPLKIQRSNVHFEGALLACSKLGLWQEALEIYRTVEERATTNQTMLMEREQDVAARRGTVARRHEICVTEHMVLSVISACVRGSRRLVQEDAAATSEERRAPLDAIVNILSTLEDRHGIPLEARHLNPLAAAYQSSGHLSDASRLLQNHLSNRKSRPESEHGDDPFNVNDVGAKDKASYALLVKGAVSTGDWSDAVNALQNMTEAGLYPKARHLNAWTEVSERKTKRRTARSWKKKRDEYWLESVR